MEIEDDEMVGRAIGMTNKNMIKVTRIPLDVWKRYITQRMNTPIP